MLMARAFTNMDAEGRDLVAAFKTLRSTLELPTGSPQDDALIAIETFCDVALRVMRKTNPSKIRDAARTVEIKSRMDGIPVINPHRPLDA